MKKRFVVTGIFALGLIPVLLGMNMGIHPATVAAVPAPTTIGDNYRSA